MYTKKILFVAIMLIFVACGGGENASSSNSSQNNSEKPLIVKKSQFLEVEQTTNDSVTINIKKDEKLEKSISFYKLFITTTAKNDTYNTRASTDNFYLNINDQNICKSISKDTKECKIPKESLKNSSQIVISGLNPKDKYTLNLEFCQDGICSKDKVFKTDKDENEVKTDTPKKPDTNIIKPNEPVVVIPPKNDLEKPLTHQSSKIKFSLSGWDNSLEKLSVLILTKDENNKKQAKSIKFGENKQNIYEQDVIVGQEFEVSLVNNTKQICNSNFAFNTKKIANLNEQVININCKSNATLEPKTMITQNIAFKENEIISLQTDVEVKNNKIQTDKIYYSSTNTNIANVDKNGNVKIKKPGNVSIVVKLDDKFYIANELRYNLKIKETQLTTQIPTIKNESSIIFDVSGYDEFYAKEDVEKMPAVEIQIGSSQFFHIRKNGKNIYSKKVSKSNPYRVTRIVERTQRCIPDITFDQTQRYADGTDIIYKLNCKTDATLVPKASTTGTTTLQFNSGQNYNVQDVEIKTKLKQYKTDKLIYKSKNPDILEVTQNGNLILKKEGLASIEISVNPKYYNSESVIVYKYKVITNTTGINIQDIHFGQSSILSTKDKFHALGANKETIIRAFIYSMNEQETHPKTTISFRKQNGQSITKDMICPLTLKQGAFTGDNYDKSSTCYIIMQSDEEKHFIEKGVEVKVELEKVSTKINEIVYPKISDAKYLNLYLIKGRNSAGVASINQEDIANIKESLMNAFAVAGVNIRVREEPYPVNKNVYQALEQIGNIATTEAKAHEFAYVLVPGQSDGSDENGIASGVARYYTGPGAGRDKGSTYYKPEYLKTLAHETGHMIGLKHALCGLAQGVDPDWYDDSIIDWAYEKTLQNGKKIRQVYYSSSPMYISKTKEIINPTEAINKGQGSNSYVLDLIGGIADLMGYCNGNRLSKYNYQKSIQELMTKPNMQVKFKNKAAELMPTNYKTIIKGKVNFNNIALEPVFVTSNEIWQELSTKNSPYQVKITTSDGDFTHPIHLGKIDHFNDKVFELVLDGNQKIKKMQFFKQDKQIKHKIKKAKNKTRSRASISQEKFSFKDDTIIWSDDYQFMSAIFISQDGTRELIANLAEGGIFKLERNLHKGELEIILSDGMNNDIEKIIFD